MTAYTRRAPRSARPARPMTDKQRDFILKLTAELKELSQALNKPNIDTMESVMADLEGFTTADASTRIDLLLTMLKSVRAESAQAQADRVEAEAFYILDGQMYRVRQGRNGRKHALLVTIAEDGSDAELEYARGVMMRLTPQMRMDPEQGRALASRYGLASGRCIICDRKLTASAEAGIGPVCAKRI